MQEHHVCSAAQAFPREQGKAMLLQQQWLGNTGGETEKDQKTEKSEEQCRTKARRRLWEDVELGRTI